MNKELKILQPNINDIPMLVINLISNKKKAESTYRLVKKKYNLLPMDYYLIPLRENENIEKVLNSDLKYLNINILYLTDDIKKVHFGNDWKIHRSLKTDMIIDKDLRLYTCQ